MSLITEQPEDALVASGKIAEFAVEVRKGKGDARNYAYQWFRDGSPLADSEPGIAGSRTGRLKIDTTHALGEGVGRYACRVLLDPDKQGNGTPKDHEGPPRVEFSQDTLLGLWRRPPALATSFIVVGSPVIGSGGSTNGCPGSYRAYVNFRRADGSGFVPDPTATSLRASFSHRVQLKWFGMTSAGLVTSDCFQEEVTFFPPFLTSYRFTAFFANPPSGSTPYEHTLDGFAPPK